MQAILTVTDTKVVCLCVSFTKDGQYHIEALVEEGFSPIRRNQPVSSYGIKNAVERVIAAAHKQAGQRITELHVGVPGAFCQTVLLRGGENEIEHGDLFGDQRYELIEKNQLRNSQTQMILGLRDYTLEVSAGLQTHRLKPKAMYAQTQVLGNYLIPRTMRERVAILLDIGYYHSDICVFTGEGQVFSAGMYLGGGHIRADLAQVLELDQPLADQLKRQFVFGLHMDAGTMDYVRMPDGKLRSYSHDMVEEIITARVDEICELIGQTLKECGIDFTDQTRVTLIGEGSRDIKGMREYIGAKLGYPVDGLPLDMTDGITRIEPVSLSLLEHILLGSVDKLRHKRLRLLNRFSKK